MVLRSMHRLGFRDYRPRPALLLHAVQVMYGPNTFAQRLALSDRRRDVGLCEKHRFGQAAIEAEVASHRGGEGAARSVGGIRALPLGLENFLFHSTFGLET